MGYALSRHDRPLLNPFGRRTPSPHPRRSNRSWATGARTDRSDRFDLGDRVSRHHGERHGRHLSIDDLARHDASADAGSSAAQRPSRHSTNPASPDDHRTDSKRTIKEHAGPRSHSTDSGATDRVSSFGNATIASISTVISGSASAATTARECAGTSPRGYQSANTSFLAS